MIKKILFLSLLIGAKVQAIDTSGMCNDCNHALPKSAEINRLATTVGKAEEKFDAKFSIVEAKKLMLHWKCDPYKRELYLTDKSEKIDPHFQVQSYMYEKDCIQDEMRLNQTPSIVQNSEGKRTVYQIIVCVHDQYYLVNQEMSVEEIFTKGKKLNPKYMMSENKCVDVPNDYSSIGTWNGIKLIFDDERYQTFNKKMLENHEKVLSRNFN